MSKWLWGVVGTGVGAVGGAGALLVLEVGAVALVAATLWLSAPAPVDGPAPVRSAAAAPSASRSVGQIQVTTNAAVAMQIDGQYVAFGPNGYLADVGVGEHRVELFDVLGRKKVDHRVTVQKNRRHSFRWRQKTFEDMGVHAMLGNDSAPDVASVVPEQNVNAAASGSVRAQVPGMDVRIKDEALGVDMEMNANGVRVDVSDEDARYNSVDVGGLEINIPKNPFGKRKGRGRRM